MRVRFWTSDCELPPGVTFDLKPKHRAIDVIATHQLADLEAAAEKTESE